MKYCINNSILKTFSSNYSVFRRNEFFNLILVCTDIEPS